MDPPRAHLADDPILPDVAYLSVAFGTKEFNQIPDTPMFYSDDLAKTLATPMLHGVQR